MTDPYKTLGVEKTATDDEIKSAYRKLAKKYHPDLNPGNKESEQKFKEINDAFKTIGTKEAREKYEKGEAFKDQFGAGAGRSGPFYREYQDGGGRYTYYSQGQGGFEDIFSDLFSQFGQRGGEFRMNGEDQIYRMEVDLKDAVKGAEREVVMPGGKRLKVKIPPGIEEGAKLRFKAQGGPAMGKGKPGDAYVVISIKPSDRFKRAGNNLEIELPVTLNEAVNGSKVKVPTVEGSVMLTIPPGVNNGSKLRVKGQGMPIRGGKERGDLIVKLRIVLPENVDQEFKDFIKKWSDEHSCNPRANL